MGSKPHCFVEVGQGFGLLVVTEVNLRIDSPSVPAGVRAARVRCDCGSTRTIGVSQLIRKQRSCGCRRREVMSATFRTHGLSKHPLYQTHAGIVYRCSVSTAPGYANYGGRGIHVYEPWRDVATFIADIERDLGPRPDGMTIDRIDNDGNYEPGNVRWATASEQNANRREAPRLSEVSELRSENRRLRALLAEHGIAA